MSKNKFCLSSNIDYFFLALLLCRVVSFCCYKGNQLLLINKLFFVFFLSVPVLPTLQLLSIHKRLIK